MQTSFKIKYTESEIPKGCRKARDVVHEETFTAELREVESEDAPLVFIGTFLVPPKGSHRRGDSKRDTRMDIDYRWFEGSLWRAYELHEYDRPSKYKLEYEPSSQGYSYYRTNRLQLLAQIDSWVNEQIIIDGEVWKRSGEPVYKFGDYSSYNYRDQCYDHGTWLTYEHLPDKKLNNASHKFFRIDEYDLAYSKLRPQTKAKYKDGEREVTEEPFNPEIYATFRILAPSILRMNVERFWKHKVEIEIIANEKFQIKTIQQLKDVLSGELVATYVHHNKRDLETRKYVDELIPRKQAQEKLYAENSFEFPAEEE